jgi:uncharacterized protein (DUF1684 family)
MLPGMGNPEPDGGVPVTTLEEFRQEKDEFFRRDPHSPLSHAQRHHFTGLNYYPENPDLSFEVELDRFNDPKEITMQTSTGDMQRYLKMGTFSFEVDGQEAMLTVYGSEDSDAFVPFVDATSGTETYGAGRYLDLEWLGGDRFVVDFNLAYNPWCAYSPDYSCPIPPKENRLTVPIRAGEMNFEEEAGQQR